MKTRSKKLKHPASSEKKRLSLVKFISSVVVTECPWDFDPHNVLLCALLNIATEARTDASYIKAIFQSALKAYRAHIKTVNEKQG